MTLSIAGRCSITGDLGICVVTSNLAVGNSVPHIKSNVGAICTQGYTNTIFGDNGLKLLEMGYSPETCLDTMLSNDQDKESRQVTIIDRFSRTAAFTGKCCVKWKGHLIGDSFVIAGNKLVGSNALNRIAEDFINSEGDLSNRLLSAIETVEVNSKHNLNRQSAALFVIRADQSKFRLNIRLHVDYHDNPINELRHIFEKYASYRNWSYK